MRAIVNGRDNHGRFARGNPGGPGRPPAEKERRYLRTLTAACTAKDWQEICQQAVEDAKKGDRHARDWLSKHLVGDSWPIPDEPARIEEGDPLFDVPPELVLEAKKVMDRLQEWRNGDGREYVLQSTCHSE